MAVAVAELVPAIHLQTDGLPEQAMPPPKEMKSQPVAGEAVKVTISVS